VLHNEAIATWAARLCTRSRVAFLPAGILASCWLAGTRCPHHVTDMATDADVGELLANAKCVRTMAGAARSLKNGRMLAGMAADYETLAHCKLTILATQQCLADSRRLLEGFSPSAAEADAKGR
jgi:hypothetical protein